MAEDKLSQYIVSFFPPYNHLLRIKKNLKIIYNITACILVHQKPN